MGKCIQTLRYGDGWAKSAFFSHDSLRLVTVHMESIQIWRIDRGECIQKVKKHDLGSWRSHSRSGGPVTLSHDARLFACPGERRGEINIWCAKTWKLRRVLVGHMDAKTEHEIDSLAFSHDSTRLASGSSDGGIQLWSVDTGECMRILNPYRGPVSLVAFSHDSTMILSINASAMLRIWQTNFSERVQVLEHHRGEVNGLILSPDSRLVVTKTGMDRNILVWSTENGESHALKGHQSYISSAVFSHDSTLLASASDEETRIWRVTTGECIHTLQEDASCLCFSHDSKLLASASSDQTIRIWHTDEGQCMHTLQGSQTGRLILGFTRLVFSNDSTLLLSSAFESVLSWRVDTGKLKDVLETGGTWPTIALSHDSQLVAIANEESGHAIIIRRLNTGKCVHSLPTNNETIDDLIFSHDSRLLAAMSSGGTARIWHIDTGDRGAFMLQGIPPMRRGLLDSVECSIRAQETPYSVGEDGSWVELNGQKLLWLPVDYRPTRWAVSKSTIVLGCKSGKVCIIRFANDKDSESPGPSFQNKYTPGQISRRLK
ncbi:WD40/YVTN repeat-like-containing domain protein, partial [Metarhizium majus ARSEF 297]